MLNVAQLERDLVAKRKEGEALFEATCRKCDADQNREMTAEEKQAINTIITDGEAIQAKIARAKEPDAMREALALMTGPAPVVEKTPALPASRLSPGTQWTENAAVQQFFKSGQHRTSSAWRSPATELAVNWGNRFHATTLTTDPASGGDLIRPTYLPGIQSLQFARMVVADLLASGTTDSNSIVYMVETTFTNAAAAVAEGAAKPESTLVFDQLSEPVRKLAHWLPVTEEMLEDVSAIRSYIDARLRLGIQLEEEDQLLNGDGTAPNISGILDRTIGAAVARDASQSNADAILEQIMALFASSFLMADGVVMNPADWATTIMTKSQAGDYLTAGPFSPIQSPTLWGLPVVVTPTIVAATALVGPFKQAAQVFRKGGLRVEASNSHQDYFIKNLVAIRAEERLALAVYRPTAFGKVTGLGSPTYAVMAARGGGGGGALPAGSGNDVPEKSAREKEREKR
jgi:HK97 family phage major capsid protein